MGRGGAGWGGTAAARGPRHFSVMRLPGNDVRDVVRELRWREVGGRLPPARSIDTLTRRALPPSKGSYQTADITRSPLDGSDFQNAEEGPYGTTGRAALNRGKPILDELEPAMENSVRTSLIPLVRIFKTRLCFPKTSPAVHSITFISRGRTTEL